MKPRKPLLGDPRTLLSRQHFFVGGLQQSVGAALDLGSACLSNPDALGGVLDILTDTVEHFLNAQILRLRVRLHLPSMLCHLTHPVNQLLPILR